MIVDFLRWLFLTPYCDATMLHGIFWLGLGMIGYGLLFVFFLRK